MAKWTEEEIQYLKENYATMQSKALVKKLNRKTEAINAKAYKLNLRKNKKTQLEIGAKFGKLTILKEVKPFTSSILSKNGNTYINKQKAFLCKM